MSLRHRVGGLLGALGLVSVAWAADGDLDPTFGTAGRVVSDFGGSTASALYALLVLPDDRIVVAGSAGDSDADFALARHQADGTIDASFGNAGTVVTPLPLQAAIHALLRQPDGKLVAVGSARLETQHACPTCPSDWLLARYLPNGALDTTFGSGGVVAVPTPEQDFASTAALQADGKIVVTGPAPGVITRRIARFDADGSLDPTFGDEGVVTTSMTPHAVAIQSDGRIVVAGLQYVASYASEILERYESDGSLDPTFGVGGIVVGPNQGGALGMALQADGRILVASDGQYSLRLRRYASTGQLEPGFGGTGVAELPALSLVPTSEWPADVHVRTDGKILVGGEAKGPAVARLDGNGIVDQTFAACSVAVTAFPGAGTLSPTGTRALGVQSDGRVVVGTNVYTGGPGRYGLARFGTSTPLPACQTAASGAARLSIKPLSLAWKWRSASPIDQADFGDPAGGSEAVFCIHDPVVGLRDVFPAPGTPACVGSGCWLPLADGYKVSWLGRLRLKLSAPASTPGKIVIRGKGALGYDEGLPLALPVVGRVVTGGGTACFEATFSTPKANSSDRFVATSDE